MDKIKKTLSILSDEIDRLNKSKIDTSTAYLENMSDSQLVGILKFTVKKLNLKTLNNHSGRKNACYSTLRNREDIIEIDNKYFLPDNEN